MSFTLVCSLIENLSLARMPFRGDPIIGKLYSSRSLLGLCARSLGFGPKHHQGPSVVKHCVASRVGSWDPENSQFARASEHPKTKLNRPPQALSPHSELVWPAGASSATGSCAPRWRCQSLEALGMSQSCRKVMLP